MKLNKEQIKEIHDFTVRKRVRYLDVQLEMVDHMASGIEAMLEQNPEMSFQDALNKEYKKFGIFGFAKIVEEKQKAIERKFSRGIIDEFLFLIKWPQMIFTFAILYFLFSISHWIPAQLLFLCPGLLFLLLLLTELIGVPKYFGQKKLLLMTIPVTTPLNLLFTPFIFYFEINTSNFNTYFILIYAILCLFYTYAYGRVRWKMIVQAQHLYPQAF